MIELKNEIIAINDFILQAEEKGLQHQLDLLLAENFTIVRANGAKLGRDDFIADILKNTRRGRINSKENVQLLGDKHALYTCIVTLTRPDPGQFWNTCLFVCEEDGQWRCLYWQVTRIPI